LDSAVISATALIYAGWSGRFNLSHGPCASPPTETATPQVPAAPPPIETPQAIDTPPGSDIPQPTNSPPVDTPKATETSTGVSETPEATATLPVGGKSEVPSTSTPIITTTKIQPTATAPEEGISKLPDTGAAPSSTSSGGGGMLGAVLLASVLAGSAVLVRQRVSFGDFRRSRQ
jgi:hypothetical protein